MFFLKIFFVSEPTQISTPLRSGGLFHPRRPGKGRSRTKRKRDDDDDDDDVTRTIPFSSGLSIDSSIGEDTRERDALRGDNERRRTKSIPHLFCVQQNDFDKKKRRERGRKRGFLLFSKTRVSPFLSSNRVRKTALLIDGVAECGVLCFVSRFFFWRNPNKEGVIFFQ